MLGAARSVFPATAAVRLPPNMQAARLQTNATISGHAKPDQHSHGSGRQSMFDLEPEVYPLIAIVVLACSGGTYMALNKIAKDQDLRLMRNDPRKPFHEPLNWDKKDKFGVQRGGETFKDQQGWTMIRTKAEQEAARREQE